MREIKFRAWDKIAKMFVQVKWAFDIDNEGVVYPCETKPKTELVLMQFTGLKDKNGKEIYEGDVVEWSVWIDAQDSVDGTENHKERFRDSVGFGSGCFKLEKRTELLFNKMAPHTELEIIGNIYENPELLTTK